VSILKNVLRFTGLAIGVTASQAHSLNRNALPLAPDNVWLNGGGFNVSVDASNLTIERTPSGQAAVDAAVELWHSIEDAEPPGGITALPFIMQGAGGGSGAGAGVALAGGTQTAATGTVVFSNSNGYSFGLSGSSQMTMSGDAFRSVIALGSTATGPTVSFLNGNGVTFGMNGNTITASVQTVGGTATGVAISAGTEVATTGAVIFSNSNNISFGLNAQTLTATFAAIKSISGGTTRATNGEVVFSNSNSISFGVAGNTITASANLPSVQRVVAITATGGETRLTVTMAAVANTNYAVQPTNAGVASIVGWDCPKGSRSTTAFIAEPSNALVSNDVIEFVLYAS
jgi:hypothetical protein